MEQKYCLSCGIPVEEERNNCKFCADENDKLYPKEVIQKGVAEWLMKITPEKEGIDFMKRAGYYLDSMPAWGK
jgi:hypothetical protein